MSSLLYGAGDSFTAGNDLEDFAKNPPGSGDSPQARLINRADPIQQAAGRRSTRGGDRRRNHHSDPLRLRVRRRRARSFKSHLSISRSCRSSDPASSLPREIGYLQAAELILLGGAFNAARAGELGLVTAVVPDTNLLAKATETAQTLARKPAWRCNL